MLAQICKSAKRPDSASGLYRRFAIGGHVTVLQGRSPAPESQQVKNLPCKRLKICATPSALRFGMKYSDQEHGIMGQIRIDHNVSFLQS